MTPDLDDVLVVTVRKSFWASPEAETFPHRLYARVFYGHSSQLLNSLVVALRALGAILVRRPRVLVLGSVERTVPWFIRARRLGLLRPAKLVVTNQLHLDDRQLAQVDRNIVYSSTWIERQRPAVQRSAAFTPLPADGDFDAARRNAARGDHVFAGGGAGRDFHSVIKAVRGTDAALEIVTFTAATLGWEGELPPNCTVRWRMPVQAFLERMASAAFVVVPLLDPDSDFGQTTVVQALALGKAVVATRSPGVVDYVEDGQEGFLVEAGDVEAYRRVILRLSGDPALRAACEERARVRAETLTYAGFAARLAGLCAEVRRA
jgi:glycosyltransferase involved in cell wall biosynthesis